MRSKAVLLVVLALVLGALLASFVLVPDEQQMQFWHGKSWPANLCEVSPWRCTGRE